MIAIAIILNEKTISLKRQRFSKLELPAQT